MADLTPEEQQQLEQILADIRRDSAEDNRVRIDWLRGKGWLTDGTLWGANLRGADLREANLRGAKLREADLWLANLGGAELSGVDLSEVAMGGADLSGAAMRRADLRRSNLRRARRSEAAISGAYMWEADLTNCILHETTLANIDLSHVIGLETIRHIGRSYVDIHTLYLSKGNIPDVFLRGCGIEDDFMEFTRGMFNKAIQFYSCFISYSREDQAFARRLHDTLQGQGIRCWLDEKQIVAGEDFREAIHQGIRVYDKVVLICSETSLTESHWVESEVERALKKESVLRKQRDKTLREMKEAGEEVQAHGEPLSLIPITVDRYVFEYDGRYQPDILRRNIVSFQGWDGDGGNTIFTDGVEKLIRGLRTDGGKVPPPPSRLNPMDNIKPKS